MSRAYSMFCHCAVTVVHEWRPVAVNSVKQVACVLFVFRNRQNKMACGRWSLVAFENGGLWRVDALKRFAPVPYPTWKTLNTSIWCDSRVISRTSLGNSHWIANSVDKSSSLRINIRCGGRMSISHKQVFSAINKQSKWSSLSSYSLSSLWSVPSPFGQPKQSKSRNPAVTS